jgi:hypothetical protein
MSFAQPQPGLFLLQVYITYIIEHCMVMGVCGQLAVERECCCGVSSICDRILSHMRPFCLTDMRLAVYCGVSFM